MLKISPIEKSTSPEADALAVRLYALLPRIRIIDLLAEVQFGHCSPTASPTWGRDKNCA